MHTSNLLLIAPEGWEQCTQEMLDRAVVGTGGSIEGVKALIEAGQYSELFSLLDDSRTYTEEIIGAILIQDSLWIETRLI